MIPEEVIQSLAEMAHQKEFTFTDIHFEGGSNNPKLVSTVPSQTAVDYIVKEISDILGPVVTTSLQDLLLTDAIHKAKAKEREQILRARQDGLDNGFTNGSWDSSLYYEENYRK